MLAFDIETTGINSDAVATCACAYDPDAGIDQLFFFKDGTHEDFFVLLDQASTLCAFNGARFDIPFLQERFKIPDNRVAAWRLKLHDLYEACYLSFGGAFSLNALLAANDMASKTGTGKDAIHLALEERWDELGAYCRQDTIKTHAVSNLLYVCLPVRGYPRLHLKPNGEVVVVTSI